MAQPASNPAAGTDTTADPTATLVATTALDLLLIELVPMAYRITTDLALREEESIHGHHTSAAASSQKDKDNDATSTVGMSGTGAAGGVGAIAIDEEEAREAVFHRLETLGYRVGLGIVERYVYIPLPLFPPLFPSRPPQNPHKHTNASLGYPAPPQDPTTPSPPSNSSAKTSGPSSSRNK